MAKRSETEMMQLILETAKSLPEVAAVAMNGSRANPKLPKDAYQDFDIVYFVTDKGPLLADRSWLRAFGEILIMQTPEEMTLFPPSLGERFTFLMQFMDGNRLDLMLCPLSAIPEWAEDPLVEVLYDPQHLLPQRVSTDEPFWLKQPTQAEVLDSWNEFWWLSLYVAKGLQRHELVYAMDHHQSCVYEYLRLLEWLAGFRAGFQQSIGKHDKWLFHLLPEKEADFAQCLSYRTEAETWESLLGLQRLFSRDMAELAVLSGFDYPQAQGATIISYTLGLRGSANE